MIDYSRCLSFIDENCAYFPSMVILGLTFTVSITGKDWLTRF